MTNRERIDRRAEGIRRVIATDGNGGKTDTIQFNVERAKVIVNFLKALVALLIIVGGGVWGGVTFGIRTEVHGEVEEQIKVECEPKGMIDTHVRLISEEYMDEVQEVLQGDLEDLDERVGEMEQTQSGLKGSVDTLISDNVRNIEEIKMLLRSAIDSNGG